MARTDNDITPESWPSMQEVYKSYIRNGYVMSDEGARKLSQEVQNAVAVRLDTADGWIEDAELAVEDKFEEIFLTQDLYPREAVMENRRESLGKAAELFEEGIEEATHAKVQVASDALSLQTLVDVCESHVNKVFRESGVITPCAHDFLGELVRESEKSHNPSLDGLLQNMYIDAIEEDDPSLRRWLNTELGSTYYEHIMSRRPSTFRGIAAPMALRQCARNIATMTKDYAAAGLVFARLLDYGAQTITPAGVREVERLVDEVAYDNNLEMADVPRIVTKCREMAQPYIEQSEAATQGVPSKERISRKPDSAERDARSASAGCKSAKREPIEAEQARRASR